MACSLEGIWRTIVFRKTHSIFGNTAVKDLAGPAAPTPPLKEPRDQPVFADLFFFAPQNRSFSPSDTIATREDLDQAIKEEKELHRKHQGSAAKLAMLEKAAELADRVGALEKVIRKWDVLHACRAVQKKILTAASRNDEASLREADRTLDALKSYAVREQAMLETMRQFAGKYPANSSLVLHLDFPAKADLSPDEPTLEHMKKLDIVKIYEGLKNSKNEEERKIAAAVAKAFGDFRENAGFYSASWADSASWMGVPAISDAQIEGYGKKLEAVYGAPEISAFLAKVGEKEAEAIQKNEGFQTRAEFEASINALAEFRDFGMTFRLPFEAVQAKLTPEILADLQKFMIDRGKSYVRFLEAEEKRLLEEDTPRRLPPHQVDPDMRFRLSHPRGVEIHEAELREIREKKAAALKDIAVLEAVDTGNHDHAKASFDALRRQCAVITKQEEAHVRGMLGKLISQAKAIPSEKDSLNEIAKGLEAVSPERMPSLKDRIAAYGALEVQIRGAVALRLVEAKIKQYETFVTEGKMTDRAIHVLSAPTRLLLGDTETKRGASHAEILLDRYRGIQAKLLSQDPARKREAMEALARLEMANITDRAQKSYEADAAFNRFTVGLGIVLFSALAAGAAVALAAPFLEGVAGGAFALQAINGSVFTVTHSIANSIVRDQNVADELFQWSTLGEAALNTVMFGYIGHSIKRYEAFLEKSLVAVTEGSVGKELVVKKMARWMARTSLGGARWVGPFPYEALKFEQFGFYVDVARRTANGDPNPVKNAAKKALSVGSILNGPLFLLALKGGFHLGAPVFGPAMEKIWKFSLEKKFQRDLGSLQGDVDFFQEAAGEFWARGDRKQCGEMLNGLESALLGKKAYLEHIPEEMKNERVREQLRENQNLLDELQGLKTFWNGSPKIFGDKNPLGVKETGDGLYSYRANARDGLVQELKGLGKNVERVEVLGDTVVAYFRLPGGGLKAKIFVPEALKRLPRR